MHPEVQAYLARESFDSYLSAIRIIREKELDYPEAVMKCGTYLLKKGGLEDDYWNVVEDVFYAALICQVPDWVKATFKQLQGKHANSKKLNKLKALLFEYQGNFKEALSAYDAILAAEPLDQEAWKRKIALHRSAGKIESAIGELNAYLEIFQSDLEAWAELSDIYLSRQAYSQAAFCWEELLQSSPQDYTLNLKYGEICYSMGGLENLKTARKYLSYTLILNKNSARALWALHQCLVSLLSLKREEKDEALKSKLERRIQKIYSNSAISLSAYPFN